MGHAVSDSVSTVFFGRSRDGQAGALACSEVGRVLLAQQRPPPDGGCRTNGSRRRQACPGAYHWPCVCCWCSSIYAPTSPPRALAALFDTSSSAVDRTIHHLVPVLADTLTPNSNAGRGPGMRIIDGTVIPVLDQAITAPSKNCRRSINTQIMVCVP